MGQFLRSSSQDAWLHEPTHDRALHHRRCLGRGQLVNRVEDCARRVQRSEAVDDDALASRKVSRRVTSSGNLPASARHEHARPRWRFAKVVQCSCTQAAGDTSGGQQLDGQAILPVGSRRDSELVDARRGAYEETALDEAAELHPRHPGALRLDAREVAPLTPAPRNLVKLGVRISIRCHNFPSAWVELRRGRRGNRGRSWVPTGGCASPLDPRCCMRIACVTHAAPGLPAPTGVRGSERMCGRVSVGAGTMGDA